MVNAMASRADEGRGTTAISFGELLSKLSRRSPNGAIRSGKTGTPLTEHIGKKEASGRSETSQYPEEKTLFPE